MQNLFLHSEAVEEIQWLWTVPYPAQPCATNPSPGSEMGAGDTAPGGHPQPAECVRKTRAGQAAELHW